MATKTATPADIDAALEGAEAEHRRLAGKAVAIREAGETTRAAVELAEIRRGWRELPKPARDAAIAARKELDALAAADPLDLDALAGAFDKRQRLDAELGALHLHLNRLNTVDPLPDNEIGVQRDRTVPVGRRFIGVKFSDYLDSIIAQREKAAYNARAHQLSTDLAEAIDAAEAAARQQAAELADGECLNIDTPERIADAYRRVTAAITPEAIESAHEANSGGSLSTTRNAMLRDALRELLDAESGHTTA
ncbi:hypothetical protein [Mycobacterium sp. URHD0025]|uniref:hypothetical protein n=1 Tax=Mycobacterium sp. URHD0025 TaxID=1298864 RepID=UPI0003FE1A93|nr:hypothetical protein [Mycobacterium sp. URHD0025]